MLELKFQHFPRAKTLNNGHDQLQLSTWNINSENPLMKMQLEIAQKKVKTENSGKFYKCHPKEVKNNKTKENSTLGGQLRSMEGIILIF